MIQVCVNGARGSHEHPALSDSPALMASAAADAVAAGAREVHLHPKGGAGEDSLGAEDVATWVRAFRERCPGVPLGVTTGAWSLPDPRARVAAVSGWTTLPDLASVNWHEEGAAEVASVLRRLGVGVEAGIWHRDGLDLWLGSADRADCARVLVEVPDVPPSAAARIAEELVAGVREAEPHLPILLHGEGASTWPVLDLALRCGMDTRIGLEDTLTTPGGSAARDNAHLVELARDRPGV